MATPPSPPPPQIHIPTSLLPTLITHKTLIHHLKTTLPTSITSPLRHSHNPNPTSTFLLMPSWSTSPNLPYLGTKLVTHNSKNSSLNLPTVHAVYILFDSVTGFPLASLDATDLTLYRTASISALASSFLSNNDAKTMVMIGAGALAPHLVKAHLAVRGSINKVVIWNRTIEKADKLAEQLRKELGDNVVLESSEDLDGIVRIGDVISCATNSGTGLVKGMELKKGAHLDLVGSFTKDMRECDDEAIRRGRVFVDCEAAVVEAGELVGAMERGVIGKDGVVGDLVELVKGEKVGRRSEDEVTVFKSVGSAVVDLLSAQLVYESYLASVRV